jgi:hypothetical protein
MFVLSDSTAPPETRALEFSLCCSVLSYRFGLEKADRIGAEASRRKLTRWGAFPMADTFSDFIARERERLHAEREQVFSQ